MIFLQTVINEYVILKNSRIHNNGVFARTNIDKGQKIIQYTGRKISKEEGSKLVKEQLERSKKDHTKGGTYIFELNDEFDLDGDIEENYAKFINHSCNPNCEYFYENDEIWILALRKIEKDEELTFNYGFELDEDYVNYPCRCGSENCVGFILHEEEWPKLKELNKKNDSNQ